MQATRRIFMALGFVTLLAAPLAQAQQAAAPAAPPVRVRGTIEQLTDTAITIKQKDGTSQVVQLPPKYSVSALVKATMDDIKQGVFIGTTARPFKGGLRATEVHIFPEAMRGAGEGHYPWDTDPDATMTNASVTKLVSAVNGSTLTLDYKGGTQTVTVVPETSIVSVTPGSKDDLKTGAAVFAICQKAPDGSLKTGFLLVGRGISPPM